MSSCLVVSACRMFLAACMASPLLLLKLTSGFCNFSVPKELQKGQSSPRMKDFPALEWEVHTIKKAYV